MGSVLSAVPVTVWVWIAIVAIVMGVAVFVIVDDEYHSDGWWREGDDDEDLPFE